MTQFNLKEFYKNETLEEMKINEKISMKDIYKKLKNEKVNNKSNIELFIKNEKIIIKDIRSNKFDLGNMLENLFLNPIEMKIEINSELHKINIIGMDHYNYICEKYQIINPEIYCATCKRVFKVNENIEDHFKHDIYIKETYNLKFLKENEFNNYFKNDINCFGKIYPSPEDFEKNFEHYFSHYSIYKNRPFKLYNGSKRKKFVFKLKDTGNYIGKICSYFGQPKIGKSISAIAVSKNVINHRLNGTLYLNLKCFYKLLENNKHEQLKEIIIDEIPYLFFNKYNDYLECYKLIDHYHFSIDDSIWRIIKIIFDFVYKLIDQSNDQKKYIFILDQYHGKFDSKNELDLIFRQYIDNSLRKRIGIITLSSMNNNDIKMYKTYLLNKAFGGSINKSNKRKFIEIEDILPIEDLTFDNNENNEYYHYLGKNIKNYNILKYYEEENKNISEYIVNERVKIEQNIKDYYDWSNEESNILKLLYFSTETEYDIMQFNEINKYIPFKYFIVKKEEKYIKIKFFSTLVEEIVNGLYEYIIYRKLSLYNALISNKLIDEGSKREIFKKYVTYYLNPCTNETNKNYYFKDIKVKYLEKMRKFIPRNDEIIIIKSLEEKEQLRSGSYLFVQTTLNGKDFDLLFIDIDKNNVTEKIIAIQISIYEENNKIFNYESLKISCQKLMKNLNNNYNFKINKFRIYFTYIFDPSYKKIEKTKFEDMLKQCNQNQMRYIFFDTEKKEFINDKGNKIENLIENTVSPFINRKKTHQEIENSEDEKEQDNILKKIFVRPSRYFDLKDSEKSFILDTIRKENSEDIINLKYLGYEEIFDMKNLEPTKVYIGKCKDEDIIYAIYYSKQSKDFKILSLNPPSIQLGNEFIHIFDIYLKIINIFNK